MKAALTKENISIKDERLDIDHIDQYRLSFFIAPDQCELAVFDERRKRLIMLESIDMDPSQSLLTNLKEIHYEHVLISAGFWKRVEVTLRNQAFCQVPNALYSGELAYDYLKLNAPTAPLDEKYLSLMDDELDCTTVFSVPHELIRWFDGKYPKPVISYRHESAHFLKASHHQLDPRLKHQLFINLTGSSMQLAGYADGKLGIYNQFKIKSPGQAAKMILLSIQQFSDEGQATPVTLWGIGSQVKEHLPTLQKYYKQLTTGERPKGIKIAHTFDVLKEYEYFDVLSSFV